MKFLQRLFTWRFLIGFFISGSVYAFAQYIFRTLDGDFPGFRPLILMSMLIGFCYGLLFVYKPFNWRSISFMVGSGLVGAAIIYCMDIVIGDPVSLEGIFSSFVTNSLALSAVFLPGRQKDGQGEVASMN